MSDAPVVLVLNGAVGVGREVVQAFALEGWRVAIGYTTQHLEGATLVRDILLRVQREAQPLYCDPFDEGEVEQLVKYLYARWGRVDGFVYAPVAEDLQGRPVAGALEVFARYLAPRMAKAGGGRLVSLGGGLEQVAALGDRWGAQGVQANAVWPGEAPSALEGLRAIPRGYLPGVTSAVEAVRFFLSPASARLGGGLLPVEPTWPLPEEASRG